MFFLLLFLGVLAVIALRLFDLSVLQNRSSSAPADPFAALVPPRADIVDRNGVYLARTFEAYAVSVRPRQLIGDPRQRARELAQLLPGTDEDVIYKTLKSDRSFAFLKRRVLPETAHAINALRSEEHTSELQSLMRISYAVFC